MNPSQKYEELRNKTLPGLLLERVKETPNAVAYRTKKLGIYKERTWSELHQKVARCAMGFAQLGLKHGDRLALMGDPREEYVICEFAAQALGAITFGIYPASSSKELYYLMNDGQASIFVAENQEYVDRILPLFDKLSHLKHIVVIDTKGVFMQDSRSLTSYEKLVEGGESKLIPGAFEEGVSRIKPTDGSFIDYTSGTTGPPKGVFVSHGKHLTATFTLIDRYPILAEIPHRTVVYLPLCHFLGKVAAVTLPLLAPIVPHYGEDMEALGQTFFEIAPTVLFTVPRYLKKFASDILIGIENSSPLKKLAYHMALKIGRRYMQNVWDGKKNPLGNLAYLICYQAVFRPILNKIGFDKLKIALSTGAPLSSDVMALWQVNGVNLSEMYGLTETGGGTISAQGPYFPRPGNVGQPPDCWEIRLSESGEILVRGNEIFEYYWNNPRLTREALDDDGWFHTGDIGEWTLDGNLRILERAQDLLITSDGKAICPMQIENVLRSNPYISEAVVLGHHRQYLSSMIEIDFETVSNWASRNNIPFIGFTSLIQHPEIIKFVGTEIEKANKNLAPDEQIKAFRIIPKELTPGEDGEPVTPTRKVKRQLMYEKFKDLVESMYSDREEGLVVSKIEDLLTQ